MPARIEWVIFDWGNVLCEYRPRGLSPLAARLGVDAEALTRFLADSGLLSALVTGEVSPEQGLDRLAEHFGRRLSRAEAGACFAADVATELPGVRALLRGLRPRYRLAVLSNTFFGHWDHFERSELYPYFEQPMASHLIGAAKPDPRAFRSALGRLGADPGRVAFVDDKLENVEAASVLGMAAIHSTDVEATRHGLASVGVTPAP